MSMIGFVFVCLYSEYVTNIIDNKLLRNVAQLKYLGMTETNQNYSCVRIEDFIIVHFPVPVKGVI